MLFDADVLIWFLRGNAQAGVVVGAAADRALSVVTYMELLQGARDKQDLKTIKALLTEQGLQMIPLTENIGYRASIYMEEFGLGSGIDLADALLAATAVENGLPLCTANDRHYRLISELQLKPFRP